MDDQKITIYFEEALPPEFWERLEESLRRLLETADLKGRIESEITGNSLRFGGRTRYIV